LMRAMRMSSFGEAGAVVDATVGAEVGGTLKGLSGLKFFQSRTATMMSKATRGM